MSKSQELSLSKNRAIQLYLPGLILLRLNHGSKQQTGLLILFAEKHLVIYFGRHIGMIRRLTIPGLERYLRGQFWIVTGRGIESYSRTKLTAYLRNWTLTEN
jgi:hypothetical protein